MHYGWTIFEGRFSIFLIAFWENFLQKKVISCYIWWLQKAGLSPFFLFAQCCFITIFISALDCSRQYSSCKFSTCCHNVMWIEYSVVRMCVVPWIEFQLTVCCFMNTKVQCLSSFSHLQSRNLFLLATAALQSSTAKADQGFLWGFPSASQRSFLFNSVSDVFLPLRSTLNLPSKCCERRERVKCKESKLPVLPPTTLLFLRSVVLPWAPANRPSTQHYCPAGTGSLGLCVSFSGSLSSSSS